MRILHLALSINLLTHYAKGTLYINSNLFIELLIKLLFHTVPSQYCFTITCISYLALEKGFP